MELSHTILSVFLSICQIALGVFVVVLLSRTLGNIDKMSDQGTYNAKDFNSKTFFDSEDASRKKILLCMNLLFIIIALGVAQIFL